jgi:hypothetical protein
VAFGEHRERLGAVARFTDQFEVGLIGNNRRKPGANDRVIVDDQHARATGCRSCH